jgi:hypothetical protein
MTGVAAIAALVGVAMHAPVRMASQVSTASAASVRMPFVGCRSDGQMGPLAAPASTSLVVDRGRRRQRGCGVVMLAPPDFDAPKP